MFRSRTVNYPPDEWVVRPLEDFGSYSLTDPETRGMEMAILMAAEPADEAVGNFQILLSSKEPVSVKFPVVDVIPHPNFMELEIHATMRPGEAVRFLPNSQATPWMDFRDLVASQDVDITTADGKLVSEAFVEQLDKLAEGAVWRWFMSATTTGTFKGETNYSSLQLTNEFKVPNCRFAVGPYKMELRLQSLPVNLDKAKAIPALQEDTAAAMVLARFNVRTKAFSGFVEGPVPTLFSKDPGETIRWLKQDKDKEAKMLMSLYNRLIQPEALDPREAVAYISSPRTGKANLPLVEAASQRNKKQKTGDQQQQQHNTNTGESLSINDDIPFWPAESNLDQICLNAKLHNLNKFLTASIKPGTSKKYESAWNCFRTYIEENSIAYSFPISREIIRGFVIWAVDKKKLNPGTVKSYLSGINFAHSVRGFNKVDNKTDCLVDLILSGAMNIGSEKVTVSKKRRAMTIPLIKILGHKIENSNLQRLTKQNIWTACCTAFFAAARMGELLSNWATKFDPESTLCWNDVRFNGDHISIHVKKPKSNRHGGEFLDIFCIKDSSFCPVCALDKLKNMLITENRFDERQPVFKIGKSRYLNKQFLNKFLREAFRDICSEGKDDILSHSFRMAIPTAVMKTGGLTNPQNVKDWGRWASSCYLTYARLQTGQKRSIFENLSKYL